MGLGIADRVGYVGRASMVMARDPVAGLERVRGRLDRRDDRQAFAALGRSVDDVYPIDPELHRKLHDALGCPWPCDCQTDAHALYSEIMEGFRAKGLPPRYQGWCDGGPEFMPVAWALTIHLRPNVVVETGVARGVTSRAVLEAIERNGVGRLVSVDLPAVDSAYHAQGGIAVPETLRHNWTLVNGTSRRELPGVLKTLGEIDLFIHDSLHTGRNTRFELGKAWQIVRPGGAVLIDDVYSSLAFHEFVERCRPRWSIVGANPDGSYRFGMALK